MATYNGEAFVEEQVLSILTQLDVDDELVIVDDASSDNTVGVLRGITDPRLRIWEQPENLGHVKTFERAMRLSKGAVLVFADQDDIWPVGRLELMRTTLMESGALAGNFRAFGSVPASVTRRLSPQQRSGWRNVMGLMLGRRGYYGSCMGLRRELLDYVLPIPSFVRSHDHWIAVASNLRLDMTHVSDDVTLRRIHQANMTRKQPLSKQLETRIQHLRMIIIALYRRYFSE